MCVAARAAIDQDQLRDIRLALGGVAEKPIVITQPAGSIEDLAQLAVSTVTPPDDYFATADYRREMIGVLTKRVLSNLSSLTTGCNDRLCSDACQARLVSGADVTRHSPCEALVARHSSG